jgi:predicted nucleic acid-binding protein
VSPFDSLKICVDLNVWYSTFLADKKGRQNTIRQKIINIIKDGACSLEGQTYLVSSIISVGMLNKLRTVIEKDQKIPPDEIDEIIDSIAEYGTPILTLGGTGVHPMTDLEDSHVLDTAISSRSHFLVTDNFRHFLEHKDVQLIEEKQLAVYQLSDSHEVYIIKPDLLGQYLSRLDSTRLNAINRSFD